MKTLSTLIPENKTSIKEKLTKLNGHKQTNITSSYYIYKVVGPPKKRKA